MNSLVILATDPLRRKVVPKPLTTVSYIGALPLELIEIIIDYCHDDRDTLLACSRVCKFWLPSSRYHLWADLRLDFEVALRFCRLPYLKRRSICAHLRDLEIVVDDSLGSASWIDKALQQMSGQTNNLGIVHIPDIQTAYLFIPSVSSTVSSTVHLTLGIDTREKNQFGLGDFLASFPILTTFAAYGIYDDANQALGLPDSLRALSLSFGNPDGTGIFIGHMVRCKRVPPLSALHVACSGPAAQLDAYLDMLRNSLEHCAFDFWDTNSGPRFPNFAAINLSPLKNLQSLRCLLGNNAKIHDAVFTLKSVTSANIWLITVDISQLTFFLTASSDWSDLDEVLSSRFPAETTIIIVTRDDGDFIRTVLPITLARGNLHIMLPPVLKHQQWIFSSWREGPHSPRSGCRRLQPLRTYSAIDRLCKAVSSWGLRK